MDRQAARKEIIMLAADAPELALERSSLLVDSFPNDVWVWSLRACVRNMHGDPIGAILDIDQAISLRPKEPGSHCDRGRYLIELGRMSEAIISFGKAIELGDELGFPYHDTVSRFMRAFCYCRLADFSSAADDLNQLDDDTCMWVDRLRSKQELIDACDRNAPI